MTDRYQRLANRRNARAVAEAPLLAHAGLVPLTTADEQRRRKERLHLQAVEAQIWRRVVDAQHRAQAQALRAEVAQVVADLAPLDAHVDRVYRHCEGIYHCYFWREVRDRVQAGLPPREAVHTWTPEDRAASDERIRRLLRIFEEVRAAHPDLLARARRYDHKAWAALHEATAAALGRP